MNALLNGLKGLAPIAANPGKSTVDKPTVNKRVDKNPENGADVRIMHTGKAYPSAEFAKRMNLEYTAKDSNTVSNGIDLFRALDWSNYTSSGNTQALLLGYSIRQDRPKVELFAGVRYNDDNTPKNSVMEQGSTLSDETLELIATGLGYGGESASDGTAVRSAWEVMLATTGKRYVDLKFEDTEGVFTLADGKYYIPKAVNKGDNKGQLVTVKREGINILLVTEFTGETAPVAQQGQEEFDQTRQDTADGGEQLTLAQDQADSEGVDADEEDPMANHRIPTMFDEKINA